MKKFSLIFSALALICFQTTGAEPLKYDGIWLLNRDKSQGLTGGLAGAEITLVVSQDSKRIHVEQKIGIRGRLQPSQELIWNLDGSKTTAEVSRPMAGTMNLTARWIEAGKILELNSSIEGTDQGKEVAVSTRELWQLLNHGKSLKITRTRNSPQGRQSFTLFFDKQN